MKTGTPESLMSLVVVAAILLIPLGGHSMSNELTPVSPFDLNRYLGRWYEIARLPAWFEKGMTDVTATYSLGKNGKVRVENAGIRDGKQKKAIGKAKFAGKSDVGHLKVAFFLSFYADYQIIALDTAEYRYAMVASSHDYLWILCREPVLDQEILKSLVDKADSLGFDTSKLYYTPQSRAGGK